MTTDEEHELLLAEFAGRVRALIRSTPVDEDDEGEPEGMLREFMVLAVMEDTDGDAWICTRAATGLGKPMDRYRGLGLLHAALEES